MKLTQSTILAALAVAAYSPAMAAPAGMGSPDPESALSPRMANSATFGGAGDILRRSTNGPMPKIAECEEEADDLAEDSQDTFKSSHLSERDLAPQGGLLKPIPILGQPLADTLGTVSGAVAGLPIVGGAVQAVGGVVTGLPIAGPLVKTLTDGLALGPLLTPGGAAPKSFMTQPGAEQTPSSDQTPAAKSFLADSNSPVDLSSLFGNLPLSSVQSILAGLPLDTATGLLNNLPVGTATGLLNNLPLGQGNPLGALTSTATGLAGNLPIGSLLGQLGGAQNTASDGTGNLLSGLATGALKPIIGPNGQLYYPSEALQGFLGNMPNMQNAWNNLQKGEQPVRAPQQPQAPAQIPADLQAQLLEQIQAARVQAEQQQMAAKQANPFAGFLGQQFKVVAPESASAVSGFASGSAPPPSASALPSVAPPLEDYASVPGSEMTASVDYASLAAEPASADPFVLASPQSLINVPYTVTSAAPVPTPTSTLDPLLQASSVFSVPAPTASTEAPAANLVDIDAVYSASAVPSSAPSGIMRKIRRSITQARENRSNERRAAKEIAEAEEDSMSDTDSCDFHSCDDGSSIARSEPVRRSKLSLQVRKLFRF